MVSLAAVAAAGAAAAAAAAAATAVCLAIYFEVLHKTPHFFVSMSSGVKTNYGTDQTQQPSPRGENESALLGGKVACNDPIVSASNVMPHPADCPRPRYSFVLSPPVLYLAVSPRSIRSTDENDVNYQT